MTKPGNTGAHRSHRNKKGKEPNKVPNQALIEDLKRRMESCPTAEQLNAEVITPFIQALVSVCDARGYVLNIYGEHCNLAITPEDHAEALFQVIEDYLDHSDLG